MRITGIEIERFGVWQNYGQPINRDGLTVFYGPNEAGKTTLLRFIRGVLYGFPPDDQLLPNKKKQRRETQSGVLRVEHHGRPYELRRTGYGEDTGLLSVSGVPSGDSTTSFMEDLLASTDEKLFESVFAVGLPELQQFATLTADQVGDHLYGMTLGPQGRVLMELPNRAKDELNHHLSSSSDSLIPSLLKRHDELTRQSANIGRQRDRYRELLRKKDEHEQRIAKHRRRQGELQSNLRGFSHLEKIHPHWSRCRDFRHELETLPDFSAFPADGVAQIERLELEMNTSNHSRENLLRDISQMNQRLSQIRIDPEIRRFSGAIQILVEQRALMSDIEPRVHELAHLADKQQRELIEHLSALGSSWSLARLDVIHDSPESHARFVESARTFQAVEAKTKRMQRRYRRLNRTVRDKELALRTELQGYGVATASLNESLDVAHQRVAHLVNLGQWHSKSTQLEHLTAGVDEQVQQLNDRNGVPDWIYGVLTWFLISGFALFFGGIYTAVSVGWLAGLIFVVLSVFSAGTALAFRSHFEQNLQEQVAQLRARRREYETARKTILDHIQAYIDQTGLREWWGKKLTAEDVGSGDLLSEAARRTCELERAQKEFLHILQVRRRLSAFRGKLQLQQRELGNARKNWCHMLAALGFDETVDVETAFAHWKHVISARDRRRKHLATLEQSAEIRLSFDRFRKQVESMANRMQKQFLAHHSPSEVVDFWEQELRTAREALKERKQLRKRQVQHRHEAAALLRKVEELQTDRDDLLELAGVTNRSQLNHRLELMERRNQVQILLEQSSRELEQLVKAQPDMAFLEDDLIRYNPKDAAGTVKEFEREHEDLELQLQQTFEQIGTIKQELKQLENDRRGIRVRRELTNVERDLSEAWQSWLSASMAEEAIHEVATQFEQANQPEMLAAAIPFLEKLTLGKYHHLWTPLGRKQLFVDDSKNESFPAERLSGGTREQLFLAIRLAMVKAFSRNNVELPMVLDDVTVNFDQDRSDAAVETLLEFTRDGQQLLVFTSHLHYAQLFEKRGVKPIYLPSRHPSAAAVEERRAG